MPDRVIVTAIALALCTAAATAPTAIVLNHPPNAECTVKSATWEYTHHTKTSIEIEGTIKGAPASGKGTIGFVLYDQNDVLVKIRWRARGCRCVRPLLQTLQRRDQVEDGLRGGTPRLVSGRSRQARPSDPFRLVIPRPVSDASVRGINPLTRGCDLGNPLAVGSLTSLCPLLRSVPGKVRARRSRVHTRDVWGTPPG